MLETISTVALHGSPGQPQLIWDRGATWLLVWQVTFCLPTQRIRGKLSIFHSPHYQLVRGGKSRLPQMCRSWGGSSGDVPATAITPCIGQTHQHGGKHGSLVSLGRSLHANQTSHLQPPAPTGTLLSIVESSMLENTLKIKYNLQTDLPSPITKPYPSLPHPHVS